MVTPHHPAPSLSGRPPDRRRGCGGPATRKVAIPARGGQPWLDLSVGHANIPERKHPEGRCPSGQKRNRQEQERAEPWQQDEWFFFSQLWRRRSHWVAVLQTTRSGPSPAPRPGPWWPTRSAAAPSRAPWRAPRPERCATTSTSATDTPLTGRAPGGLTARARLSRPSTTTRSALRGSGVLACAFPTPAITPLRPVRRAGGMNACAVLRTTARPHGREALRGHMSAASHPSAGEAREAIPDALSRQTPHRHSEAADAAARRTAPRHPPRPARTPPAAHGPDRPHRPPVRRIFARPRLPQDGGAARPVPASAGNAPARRGRMKG